MAEKAYIGTGSNLGDRQAYLEAGLTELKAVPDIRLDAVSAVYETAPLGYTNQPLFLNAAASIETTLFPEELLQVMQGIETRHHRQRLIHWGPRTLDLDLLLYAEYQINTQQLVLPHPRLVERCFVLAPLCEIAPDLRHPRTGRLLSSCCEGLDCTRQVHKIGVLKLQDLCL